MSSYTMELRKVCDIYSREEVESWFSSYNLEDYLTEEQIQTITTAGMWSKQKLAKQIIDHYYMREIGFETPYLFRHFAITKMNEIMERKLPLIYSKAIEYNPLVNVDFTEQYTKNITGTLSNTQSSSTDETITDNSSHNSSSTENESGNNSTTENRSSNGTSQSASTNSSSSLNVNSDTPQGQISKTSILSGNYASSTSANENSSSINDSTNTTSQNAGTLNSTSQITKNNSNTFQSAENISKSNENEIETSGTNTHAEMFTRTMKGNSGSITTVQHLIKQFREIIVGVNEEVIDELNSLFIALF